MSANKKAAQGSSEEKVSIREAAASEKRVKRSFPGPRGATALLRVAVSRGAYAELVAHAKESLDVEVCGVLVGQICEDEQGVFVEVEAVIRGAAASEASTHVTFTQATWNAIHQSLDRDYPKLRMVGWYHTHPGFGVEFSDMDLFIQKNFFSGPTQIALVTDPLSGAVAICVNTPDGPQYLERFWIDGREQPCRVPARRTAGQTAGSAPADDVSGSATAAAVRALETRVSQLVQALDEERAYYHRFLLFVGMVFCLAIIAVVGYVCYSQFISRNEPPKLNQFVPIPVQVGDKVVLLGVGIAEWQVPPELNATLIQLEKLKQEAAEKAAREAAAKSGTNSDTPPDARAATNSPPQTPPGTGHGTK